MHEEDASDLAQRVEVKHLHVCRYRAAYTKIGFR